MGSLSQVAHIFYPKKFNVKLPEFVYICVLRMKGMRNDMPFQSNNALIDKFEIMKEKVEWWKSITSCLLIAAILCCSPIESLAQASVNKSKVLEYGTQVVLRINENFKGANNTDNGMIPSTVAADVYSADGTEVLIKAGTPAIIEYTAESNGICGKAGQICLTHATTKTIDNKSVSLNMTSCKKGGDRLGGVIALSVLFFPIGLISLCMKGSMPNIQQGSAFTGLVMQDVVVD